MQLQLAAMKERNNAHAIFTRNRFKIRRNNILEDAFSQLNALAEEDLRGVVILSPFLPHSLTRFLSIKADLFFFPISLAHKYSQITSFSADILPCLIGTDSYNFC